MGRAVDLIAVVAVAVVLLLPKASLEASPALDPAEVHKTERDRVGALEDALAAAPDDVDRAVALGDQYLRLLHADWALSVTARFASAPHHKLHMLRATARAERLEAKLALDEIAAGLAACDKEGADKCPETERVRFAVLEGGMKALVDGKIDPHKQPKEAREAVAGVLHSTKTSDKAFSIGKPAPSADKKPAENKPAAPAPQK